MSGGLRRSVAALLPGLPLLLALAAPAAAQTTVSLSSPDYPVSEGDAVKVRVVLSASRATDTTVQLQAFPLTANEGVDYIGARHTVTIPAGQPGATLTIRTVEDALKEVRKDFQVGILANGLPDDVTRAVPIAAFVHIQDDDQDAGSVPKLQIARYGKYVMGDRGLGHYAPVVEGTAASFSVTVGTDWASPAPLTVSLKVSEDAREGQDFVAAGNEGVKTMTIDPWRDGAVKIFQVPTSSDSIFEAGGAVTVTLVPTDDYAVDVGNYQATVEVVDNGNSEGYGLVLTSSTPMFGGLTMEEGGGGGYTVRLKRAPTSDVTVSVTRRDDGDGDGDWSNVRLSRTSLTFTADNWHVPQRIDVFSQADPGHVNDRFSLVHMASGGGYNHSDYIRISVVDNPPTPQSGDDQDSFSSRDSDGQQQPDYSALKAKIQGYADETQHGQAHVERWNRVLAALGDQDAMDDGHSPMTAAEAQTHADKGWTRWDEVVTALTELESRAAAEAQAEPEPEPDPELSLSAGTAVDEGASAAFTIHAAAAPAADLTVSVSVAQSGDWLDSPGAGIRMVTLAAGATTASLDIATVNDSVDEPDGSVSLTLDSGAGYTVASSPNDTATVTVRDDDDPPPAIPIGSCVSVPQWKTVKGYYDSNANRSPNYGANWYRVLIAYQQDRGDQTLPVWTGQTAEPTAAYTAEEAENGEKVWRGWTPVRGVLECLERTYGGTSTSSAVGGVPAVGQSGEVGTANPDPSSERNRWNPQTAPGGFEPDAMPDFAAGSCVSPRLRSEAAARAGEAWRGPVHVERWLRVMQTFTGGANDATVVTPAEANFHTAAGRPGWLPVADALRCMEQQSLREAMSR